MDILIKLFICVIIYCIFILFKNIKPKAKVTLTNYDDDFLRSEAILNSIQNADQIKVGYSIKEGFINRHAENDNIFSDVEVLQLILDTKKQKYDPKGTWL